MAPVRDDDWLDGVVPIELFKEDRHSRVWLVRAPALGRVVVKRYEFSPLRQRLAWLVKLHPGQRERRMNRYLAARGVPVLPVIQAGVQRRLTGDRLWLARPMWGRSLQRWLARPGTMSWEIRWRVTHGVAQIITRLLDLGLIFPALTTDNLIVSTEGQVWLNDVGQLRHSRRRRRKLRMLATLDRFAAAEGANRSDRLRCLRLILAVHQDLGDLRSVSRAIAHV